MKVIWITAMISVTVIYVAKAYALSHHYDFMIDRHGEIGGIYKVNHWTGQVE